MTQDAIDDERDWVAAQIRERLLFYRSITSFGFARAPETAKAAPEPEAAAASSSSAPTRAPSVRETLEELPELRGNIVHDLHTAVLMREHGISRICTRDADFHRFPFLSVIDPLR